MRLVLVTVGEYLLDEVVEVGVGAEGALRDELLPARGALLVAGAQRRNDALSAKPEIERQLCVNQAFCLSLDSFSTLIATELVSIYEFYSQGSDKIEELNWQLLTLRVFSIFEYVGIK